MLNRIRDTRDIKCIKFNICHLSFAELWIFYLLKSNYAKNITPIFTRDKADVENIKTEKCFKEIKYDFL